MNLRRKFVLIVTIQMVVLGVVLCAAYYRSAEADVVGGYVEKARAVVLTVESAREEMGRKWEQGIFSQQELRQWADHGDRDKVLAAIPVVSAWRAAMAKAKEGGYTFRVPKFQPRNPRNEPDPIEARVLRLFENGGPQEHYEIDPAKNAIRYFRPIRLTSECLLCHGDPRDSVRLWGNDRGLDPTGSQMEGWKVGEVHGAFEVIQSLDAAQARLSSNLRWALIVISVLIGAALALVAWFVTRKVVDPIARDLDELVGGAAQVRASANQVSGSAQSLAQGAAEQAASLEETSASMEQIAASTRSTAESSQRAASLVQESSKLVEQSNDALAEMVNSMSAIRESSQAVARIIKTIDEIAFQTNILALNAAVEAARAGESGMGFAVVADEVRTLAQRSAQAARDTSGLIEASIASAETGAAKVERVTAGFTAITASTDSLKSLVEQIASASREQMDGISQVSTAVTQMEKVTQTTAAAAEESAAASEELDAQAQGSTAVVLRVAQLVMGVRHDAKHHQQPPSSGGARPASPVGRAHFDAAA